ncbi:MAG: GNAT family N-acetyltransferase, partial [Candidatus Bathyarchaeota archaeon]|nr:GNAT family N-acetyltransferase [Candidatus Bathyarchaeota archaeon]
MLEGPRAAKPDELPKILDLVNEVFMAPRGLPPIMGEVFQLLFNINNLDNLRVVVRDGKPISHVGIWEGNLLVYGSWLKVGMIGAVCTHRDFRGRGYASTLVMDALRKMRADGV